MDSDEWIDGRWIDEWDEWMDEWVYEWMDR